MCSLCFWFACHSGFFPWWCTVYILPFVFLQFLHMQLVIKDARPMLFICNFAQYVFVLISWVCMIKKVFTYLENVLFSLLRTSYMIFICFWHVNFYMSFISNCTIVRVLGAMLNMGSKQTYIHIFWVIQYIFNNLDLAINS